MSISIIDAIEDPKLFGSLFKDQETWSNWKVFLSALFGLGIPETKEARALYLKCTGHKKVIKRSYSEAYAIAGRRGGKSFISSVIACYLALFYDWAPYLSKGELGWIMVVAADRNQGRVIFNYIKSILLDVPIFNKLVDKDLSWEIHLKNNIVISIKTCDYRTIRGYTVVAAICDELAFWRAEGANPAKEILTALRPAMLTIPGSMLIGISTPYARMGALYQAYKKHFGKEKSDTLIWRASTEQMNPTVDRRVIKKALEEDYSRARAEYFVEWREDIETYLPIKVIDAAVVKGRYQLPKEKNYQYYAFTDPSGSGQDSFTLAIAHEDDRGKIVLDRIEERRPPFVPQDVVEEFAEILKDYGIYQVVGDRYAGEWVSSTFERAGISYETSTKNKSEIYLEFAPQMTGFQVELLDNRKLYNQLVSLERRTHSGGRNSVDHPPGGHDDLANSVAGVVVEIKKPRVIARVW